MDFKHLFGFILISMVFQPKSKAFLCLFYCFESFAFWHIFAQVLHPQFALNSNCRFWLHQDYWNWSICFSLIYLNFWFCLFLSLFVILLEFAIFECSPGHLAESNGPPLGLAQPIWSAVLDIHFSLSFLIWSKVALDQICRFYIGIQLH